MMDDLTKLMVLFEGDPKKLLCFLTALAVIREDSVMAKALQVSAKICEIIVPVLNNNDDKNILVS